MVTIAVGVDLALQLECMGVMHCPICVGLAVLSVLRVSAYGSLLWLVLVRQAEDFPAQLVFKISL